MDSVPNFAILYSERDVKSPGLGIEATRENFPYMYETKQYKEVYSFR